MCRHLFENEEVFKENISELLLDLAYDKVPNVKIVLARFIVEILGKKKYAHLAKNETIRKIVKILKNDNHKIIESKEGKKHEVLKEMLLLGSDPNIKDSNGWTALHYACHNGVIESVKILVEHNADINSFSNNKRTPLHLAAKMNRVDIVNYLIDKILSKVDFILIFFY